MLDDESYYSLNPKSNLAKSNSLSVHSNSVCLSDCLSVSLAACGNVIHCMVCVNLDCLKKKYDPTCLQKSLLSVTAYLNQNCRDCKKERKLTDKKVTTEAKIPKHFCPSSDEEKLVQ